MLAETSIPDKKLDTIDTPHGKLTKAPEGGSLGDFQGQKVKAEMDFPDGHKAKNLESGKCAICSNCETIKAKFGDELKLEENLELAENLKKIENDLKVKPGDPDLIAKQKAMHDKLYKDKIERLKKKKTEFESDPAKVQEIEAEINTTKSERVDNTLDIYDQKVKDGQYTRKGKTDAEIEDIKKKTQEELDKEKVMNPESGQFHSGDAHTTKRMEYLGDTPGKSSKTGKEVIERMRNMKPPAEGRIRFDRNGNPTEVYGKIGKSGDVEDWFPIAEADMGHLHNAVTYWNETGILHGPKSPEVRKWMLDSNNYELQHYSYNRSQGSLLGASGERYLDP